MTKLKGSDLIFISRIRKDGSGTDPVGEPFLKILQDEEFAVRRLSMSENTYIATGMSTFVVRLNNDKIITWDNIMTELIKVFETSNIDDLCVKMAIAKVILHLEEKYEAPTLKK